MFKSVDCDPLPDSFGHTAEFRIAATLHVIVALQFQRNLIRPALGALHKTVIESGHGSWGIYTKKLIPAGRAEVACQTPILRYQIC